MRTISIDINNEKGKLNRFFSKCIGAGRAAEVMRHTAYEQLCTIQKECPFEYIRFHGLFHDEMAIVRRDKNGKLHFNFQYIDLLFDSLLDINIRPVVELGLMPEDMASKDEHVFWWKMNTSPPKYITEWYSLIKSLVIHLTERYGEEEIKKWYFEVWNEPNLKSFFSEFDNMNAYFEIYDNAALAIKSVCSEYRVGGPTTAFVNWLDEFIEHCNTNNIPYDFISCHIYCVSGGFFDADGNPDVMMKPTNWISDTANKVGDLCHKNGVPFLMTEWSTSPSSRDTVHDSYYSAPFILEAVKNCEGHVDLMSYWVYTDIFEEVEPPRKIFHGGFGLFTVQSIKKPAYYSYQFLSRLSDTELLCDDVNCYACRSENEVQVLFWNNKMLDQGDELNSTFFTHDLPSAKLDNAIVKLTGFKAESVYSVNVQTIGYRMGDCYDAYLDMGSPETLTREMTTELIDRSQPKTTFYELKADKDGTIELSIPQSENQVDLIIIDLK